MKMAKQCGAGELSKQKESINSSLVIGNQDWNRQMDLQWGQKSMHRGD